MTGKVLRIFTSGEKAAPMREVGEIEAVAGKGIEGDRYFSASGTYSAKQGPWRHVTLVESEALDALRRDYQIELRPEETRRNLLTENVPLNHLVGREFTVGTVRLRGVKLCEPCAHLEKLTGKSVKEGLRHRGGLNAEIVLGGTLRVGDAFNLEPEEITARVSVPRG